MKTNRQVFGKIMACRQRDDAPATLRPRNVFDNGSFGVVHLGEGSSRGLADLAESSLSTFCDIGSDLHPLGRSPLDEFNFFGTGVGFIEAIAYIFNCTAGMRELRVG